jgi:hypothetical protein
MLDRAGLGQAFQAEAGIAFPLDVTGKGGLCMGALMVMVACIL